MRNSWEIMKLGEVCDLMTGGTPSRNKPEYFTNGKIKWLVSGDVNKEEIFDCEGRITEEGMENSNTKYLPVNSVLIALNGQGKTRGTVALLRTKATCNQSLVSIFPKNIKELLPEYIFCNLHGRYEEIRKITGDDGNDRRGLNMPLLRNIEIPIPPLPEQQRIVTILDEVFAAIAKAKANAEKNLQNAKELFESYLQNVFVNSSKYWVEKELREVCDITGGGTPSKANVKYYNGDIPWATVRDMKYDIIKETEHKITKDAVKKSSTNIIPKGNVIIASRVGLGKVCLIKCDTAINQDLKGVIPKNNSQLLVEFLFRWFKSISRLIILEGTGATVQGVKLPFINSLKIPIPSTRDQKIIIAKLDSIEQETKKLETIYQQKLNDLEELKKSILQKAFNGELTYDNEKVTV